MSKQEQSFKFDTENDLTVTVASGDNVLVKEECCTCITIVLNNEGKIMTSFMGGHNPYIVSQLEKAQKAYFKALKQALKADYKNDDECLCGDECECHGHHHEEDCECGDHCECDSEHHCGDPKCHNKDCHCTPEHHCGCYDGKPCKCGKEKKTKQNKSK